MKESAQQEGIKLRISELEKELNLLLDEPARMFNKYKARKITRINKSIHFYKLLLDFNPPQTTKRV